MEYDLDDGILSAGTLDGQICLWQVYMENDLYVGCSLIKVLSLEAHVLDIIRSSCLPRSIITLESDFSIREYDLGTGKLLKTVKADKPLVDVFVIEANGGRTAIVFAIDNANNLHRIPDWAECPTRLVLPSTPDAEVNIKRYVGYNHKSQIYIRSNELLLLTCDQSNQSITVNKLNIL